MTAAIVVVALAGMVGVVTASVVASHHADAGWTNFREATNKVIELQQARITTLENRLLASHWSEFANLQTVPDELAKQTWAESHRRPDESFGVMQEEREAEHARLAGSDLEGDTFEGPTIG